MHDSGGRQPSRAGASDGVHGQNSGARREAGSPSPSYAVPPPIAGGAGPIFSPFKSPPRSPQTGADPAPTHNMEPVGTPQELRSVASAARRDWRMSALTTRILIVEHDPDLAQMLKTTLTREGYHASWMIHSSVTVEAILQNPPHLIVVSGLAGRTDGQHLLETLMEHPVSRQIPVLTMVAGEQTITLAGGQQAKASLSKPFHLGDFLLKVQEVMDQPGTVTQKGDIFGRAEGVLARHSQEALFRWSQRLRQSSPWQERDDLRVHDVLDSTPVLVQALIAVFCYGANDSPAGDADDNIDHIRGRAWQAETCEQAQRHSQLRRSQGLPLVAVMREYTLLRDELWELLQRYLTDHSQPAEMCMMAWSVNATLDRLIEETIFAYDSGSPAPGPVMSYNGVMSG